MSNWFLNVVCEICKKSVEGIQVKEDAVLCRKQYVALCHGAKSNLEHGPSLLACMYRGETLIAFAVQQTLALE